MEKKTFLIIGLIGGILAIGGGLTGGVYASIGYLVSIGGAIAIVCALAMLRAEKRPLSYLMMMSGVIALAGSITPLFGGSPNHLIFPGQTPQYVEWAPVLAFIGGILISIAVVGYNTMLNREKKEAVKRVDDEVLKYIIGHKWEISKPQAAKDLGLSIDELDVSIERLTMAGKLERE